MSWAAFGTGVIFGFFGTIGAITVTIAGIMLYVAITND